MGFLKKSCAVVLASAMALGIMPGMNLKAAEAPDTAKTANESENGFDAYRTPFLSGTLKTWIYQGEEFDYENSRNIVFADDQEDGDLTKNIVQTGSIDTSKLGDQTVTYRVTDSDGRTAEHTLTVSVLAKDSGDTEKKNIKRILYTLPDASHLTNIGFNRGYNHDRQNLGFWLPENETMKIRLVNHTEFTKELNLKLLNIDATTEKLVEVKGEEESDPKDSVRIPAGGEWITVKNQCIENEKKKSVDSVPFIYTPKNTTVQPVVEVEWNDAYRDIPYYRYGDDESAFFSDWDKTEDSFAIIEGQAATFLAPRKNRYEIIDHPDKKNDPVYQFHTIDEMLDWAAAFEEQYDAYSGLDFYTDKPYNQNVRAKFFIKANVNGAGLAYYSGDHSAFHGDNLGSYLYKDWTSLHEFGHGYEGAIANQENSFVETTNNIMGYYFEPTYRPEKDFGWLLGGYGNTKLEAYNALGRESEQTRNAVPVFNDITAGRKMYKNSLFMFVNMLDRLGPEKTTAAMHTTFRKYNYEHGSNMSSSEAIVESFSQTGGYNVIPYFEGWHIHASEVLEDKIYDQDLPMLYYLRNLYTNDEEAETVRQALAEKGKVMNGIYSLVSTDDLAELQRNDTSNVTLNVSIDDLEKIRGKYVVIKNGSKIVKRLPVENAQITATLPVGIYEVELPMPREKNYQYGNEYLVAAKGAVTKDLEYKKVTGNLLADDMQIRMTGMGGEIIVVSQKTGENKINVRINNVEPHVYFEDKYVAVRVYNSSGTKVFDRTLTGKDKADAYNEDFDFPVGTKIELDHEEIGKMYYTSQYTKKDIPAYYIEGNSGIKTVTYVMTDRGLMQQDWDEAKQKDVFVSMMNSYSDYLLEHMAMDDLASESKFHNAKIALAKAYELLDDEEKAAYDAVYGRILGHEQTIYGYHKIDSSALSAVADSQNSVDEGAQKALDKDLGTIWHTKYDQVNVPGNYTITLPENIDIGKLDYVPRQGNNNNGRILSCELYYSETESGEDFKKITLPSITWADNANTKSLEFDAKNARRIRIRALTTAGEGGANKFITAAEFCLYEKFEKALTTSYLSDLTLGSWDASVQKDETLKSVSIPAGTTVTADLIGKEFDKFTSQIVIEGSLGNNAAEVKIYGDDNPQPLYQFDTSAGDLETSLSLDIEGIRNLKIETSGPSGSTAVFKEAAFGNQDNKENIYLVSGDRAAIAENLSLLQDDRGKAIWTSSNPGAASVDENGIITAVGAGETTVTAAYADEESQSFACKVVVKENLAGIVTAIQTLKNAKKTELNEYTNADNYGAESKTKRAEAIAAGEAAIDKAMNISGMNAALQEAKENLDSIETKEQAAERELAQAKEEAKQKLDNYTNINEYDQRIELKRAIAEGKANIDKASDIAGVNAALKAAKAAIDAINLEKKTFTVTFMSDGAEVHALSQTVALNGKAVKPTKEMLYEMPEKEGYEFVDWYADSKFEKKYDFNAVVKSNLILYAKWKEIPPEILEGEWIADRNPNGAVVSSQNGVLELTGGSSSSYSSPTTFVSKQTFDFTQEGFFEFDLEYTGNNWMGVYLGYKNGSDKALGMFFGFDDYGWFWQKYSENDSPWYQGEREDSPGADNLKRVRISWTNDRKFSLEINGEKIFEQEDAGGSVSADTAGKIAFAGTPETTIKVSNILPATEETVISPSNVEVVTAKDSVKLKAVFRNSNGQNPSISWSSSDEDVALVDKYGNVYFVGVGTATITAEAVFSDGTSERVSATVTLPEQYEGDEDLSGKAWANTQENNKNGNTYGDGVANLAVDGKLNTYWHSQYSGFTVSETNPAVFTVEFPRDLSEYDSIEALQKPSGTNGYIQSYKLVTGDAYNESTYQIMNNPETGINRVEGEKVTDTTGTEEVLALPETTNKDGKFGHYLQIQVFSGHGNYAAIKEILAHLNIDYSSNPVEQGYMAANRTLVDGIADLESLIQTAEGKEESDYSEKGWLALRGAITKAKAILKDGVTVSSLKAATDSLNSALNNSALNEITAKKEQLQTLYTKYMSAAYQADAYTAASFTAFDHAHKKADEVLNKGNASLSEIDEALEKLNRTATALIEVYTVTFDWNYSGSTNITNKVTSGFAATEPEETPEREGQIFTGKWYKEAVCKTEYDFNTEKVTESITLYAGWKTENEEELETAKTEINRLIQEAENLEETDFSEESWTKLQAAIAEAREIAADCDSTDLIRQVKSKLETAMSYTKDVELSDIKADLDSLCEAAEFIKDDAEFYNPVKWTAYVEAYDQAKAVAEKGDSATFDEIREAKNALLSALEDLTDGTSVDKSVLEDLLKEAAIHLSGKYTASSLEALRTEIASAEKIKDSAYVAQSRVDSVAADLQNAIDDLVPIYTVTFHWNYENASTERVEAEKGSVVTAPDTAPNREGYTFTGEWYRDADCAQKFDVATEKVTGNMTLYAGWNQDKIPEHNVTFNWNYEGADVETKTVESGSPAVAPLTAPNREGYTFTGKWYRDAACTEEYDFTENVTSDLTLYAGWRQDGVASKTYIVTFNWNYEGATTIRKEVDAGSSVASPDEAPEREGYTFTGKWYRDAACTEEYNFTTEKVTDNLTLYAGWRQDGVASETYIVTFNWNYEGATTIRKEVDAGSSVASPDEAPEREGYTFTGKWYRDAACTEEYNFTTEKVTDNLTLYAGWRQDGVASETYFVTFNWNYEGGKTVRKEVDAGSSVAPPDEAPEREGYTFTGKWHLNKACTEEYDFTTEKVTDNLTLYAEWNQNGSGAQKCTVTFDWNYEGSQPETKEVEAGSFVTPPETVPKRSGYTFTGVWYRDKGLREDFDFSEEAVTEDLTLYADWEKDEENQNNGGSSTQTDTAKKNAISKFKSERQTSARIIQAGKKNYTDKTWNAFVNVYNSVKNITDKQLAGYSKQRIETLTANLTKARIALAEKKEETKTTKVTSLKFQSSKYQIAKGKSINLLKELTILPESAKSEKLTWKITSNNKYAQLSGSGSVKLSAKGAKQKVVVMASTADGKVSATATIQIMKGSVSKVTASGKKNVTAARNKTVTLKAKVKTKGGKPVNKALKWTSSNPAIATVKGKGKQAASAKVKIAKNAKKGKTVKITAAATDGTGKKVVFKVKVK